VSAPAAGERRSRLLPALNLAVVVLISVLDWMTPAGVVVGILASIPIVLASFTDRRDSASVSSRSTSSSVASSGSGGGPMTTTTSPLGGPALA